MSTKSLIGLLFVLGLSAPASAQRPTTPLATKASRLSAAEISQIHTAFQSALRSTTTRDALRAIVMQQLRTTKPIAFVKGHWVVPIDVAAVYGNANIRTAIVTQLGASPLAGRLSQVATFGMADRLGLAFVPNQFGNQFIGVSVAGLRQTLAEAAFLQNGTDMMPGDVIEGAQAGVTGALVILRGTGEVLGGIADAFTNWWTGGGPKDPNTGLQLDDPSADPDGDGVPNRLDGDDDGDGTPDKDDQAPHDPGTQICFDCMGRTAALTFTNASAAGVLQTVFNAYTAAKQTASANRAISLGTAARVSGQLVSIQVGFAQ